MCMLSYGAVVKVYYKVNTLRRTQRISAIVMSSSRVRILSCSWCRTAHWVDGKLFIQPVLWMSVSLLIFGHLSYTRSPFNLPVALIRFTALRGRTSLLSLCISLAHPRQHTDSTQRVLISFQPRGYFFRVKIVMEKHRLTNGLRRRGQ